MQRSGLPNRSGARFLGATLGTAILLAGTIVAAPGAPARAEPLTASYEVYFGGFHVLNADAQWLHGPRGYRITAEAETQGFLGWLNPWKGATESRGKITAGKAVPQHHENRGSSDKGEKLVILRYDPAGNVTEAKVQPEIDWVDRHPLPHDAHEGTLDPLSVLAGISEVLRQDGPCEGEFSVFDGRRRYDLVVSDAGTTTLEPTDYSIFSGLAHGCRLDYKLLGGHRIERNKYAATARERIVWVGRPTADAPLLPVRLQIETAYGTVMGHLTGFSEGPQAEARLTE